MRRISESCRVRFWILGGDVSWWQQLLLCHTPRSAAAPPGKQRQSVVGTPFTFFVKQRNPSLEVCSAEVFRRRKGQTSQGKFWLAFQSKKNPSEESHVPLVGVEGLNDPLIRSQSVSVRVLVY